MPNRFSHPNSSKDINVLALVKGKERYVYLYDDENRVEALRALGRHARNPELSFTWYDAAVLSQKIRQEARNVLDDGRGSQPEQRFSLPDNEDSI